jgi:hypothetical protein
MNCSISEFLEFWQKFRRVATARGITTSALFELAEQYTKPIPQITPILKVEYSI